MAGDQMCCCKLRTGVLTVGYLVLILAIVEIIAGSVGVSKYCGHYYPYYYYNYDEYCTFYSSELAGGCIYIIAGSLLLAGVYKNNPCFMIPYFVLTVLKAIANSILSIFWFVNGYIGLGFLFIAALCVNIFFITSVQQYRTKVLIENRARTIMTAPGTVFIPGAGVQSYPGGPAYPVGAVAVQQGVPTTTYAGAQAYAYPTAPTSGYPDAQVYSYPTASAPAYSAAPAGSLQIAPQPGASMNQNPNTSVTVSVNTAARY